eukprot:5196401-Amphidinium_carterae.2
METKQNVMDTRQDVMETKKRLAPIPLSGTPATRAKERRVQAKEFRFEDKEGEGALSPEDLQSVRGHQTEKLMNCAFRPILAKIVPKCFLVDSQAFKWEAGVASGDFFAAQCYEPRVPGKSRKRKSKAQEGKECGALAREDHESDGQPVGGQAQEVAEEGAEEDVEELEAQPTGVPALMDSVTVVFEGKRDSIQQGDQDQLHRYLSATSADCGLLYDPDKFLLMVASGEIGTEKRVKEIHEGNWSQPGALPFLHEMCKRLEPPNEYHLRLTLQDSQTTMDKFLGKGNHGRVFQVQGTDEIYAMKISTDITLLEKEVERLRECRKYDLPVVEPKTDVLHVKDGSEVKCAYFLMQPVGKQITVKSCQTSLGLIDKLFAALQAIHNRHIVHGDARIQNIIQLEDEDEKNSCLWTSWTHHLQHPEARVRMCIHFARA